MPFYLEPNDIASGTAGLRSVLIVPCGFCPAASLAVSNNKPYVELLRSGWRTRAYETFIRNLQRRLEGQGVRTAVFNMKLPHRFVACMWTSGSRRRLAKRADEFDGVLVLGCDGAVQTVRDSLGSSDCRVIAGMDVAGLMNAIPKVRFPLNITLEMTGVTPVEFHAPTPGQQTV